MKELTIFSISAIILLLAVVYQDFKSRQISFLAIVALFFSLFLLSYINNGVNQTLLFFLINFLFTAVELSFIYIYLKLRKKIKTFSEINSFFGWGDVLFLFVLCFAFSPFNYILFTLSGSLICLLFLVVRSWLSGDKIDKIEVPYAGILAGWLILLLIDKIFIRNFNFYDDLLLMNLLNE